MLEIVFDINNKKLMMKEWSQQLIHSPSKVDLLTSYYTANKIILKYDELLSKIIEIEELKSIADKKDLDFISNELKIICDDIDRMYLECVFDEIDKKNAVVSINAGSGGLEAQDWAGMLFRMYYKWGEKRGYDIEVLNIIKNDKNGIKSVDFIVKGVYAYGYLKQESGVHRLVRNSPFDADGCRHTSFASIFVSPEVDDKISIDIKDSDLRIDKCFSSGPGGQNVNKVESAVRITHKPTKVSVFCQSERSQHHNIETAMRILLSKLYEIETRKQKEALQENYNNLDDVSWGYQRRSYFLHPKVIIKDHILGIDRFDADAILNGDIDEFIEKSLLATKR